MAFSRFNPCFATIPRRKSSIFPHERERKASIGRSFQPAGHAATAPRLFYVIRCEYSEFVS
jgi:hypothetical protein